MVIVSGIDSQDAHKRAEETISKLPGPDEVTNSLVNETKEGEVVYPDTEFRYPSGHKRYGFYMDGYLKNNIDNFLIPAVVAHWDGVGLITGMEGSSKSTNAFSIAKYLDNTFPGEIIKEGSTKRYPDRIVFTPQQFMEAIDHASPRQAIVFDEAIMGFMASDASTEIQKALIKKMVTIRKKQLFILIVLPSIFLLRMYLAIFRTRFMIHLYSPDGIQRGFFKFYSYETKRKLYIDGKKDFNQDAVAPDFKGRFTNTEGLFFPLDEYEAKKDAAIKSITELPNKKDDQWRGKEYVLKGQRDILVAGIYKDQKKLNPKLTFQDFSTWFALKFGDPMKFSEAALRSMVNNAEEFLASPDPVIKEKIEKSKAMLDRITT